MKHLWLQVICGSLFAASPSLEFHVSNPQGRPMPGVVLSVAGSSSAPTDRKGRTHIDPSGPIQPRMWVDVRLTSPPDVLLLSPWDSLVRVPPFEKDSFIDVIAGRRGERALLESGPALASMAAHVLASSAPEKSESAPLEQRRSASVIETARQFGLEAAQMDGAIRGLEERSKDPFEKGMASLYAGHYDDAAARLSEAVLTRGKQLRKVPAEVVAASLFLGQALFEQGKFDKAADAYRRALALRPQDSLISNGLGLALLKSGKPELAEPFLKRQ